MADLTDLQAAETVKIVGANSSGIESTPINATNNGAIHSNLRDSNGIEIISSSAPSLNAVAIPVRNIPFEPATYSAAASGFTIAATATDIFNITGSVSKTIRVLRMRLTGTTTSGSPITVSSVLVKRSTANTGGTRVSATVVPNDSSFPSGTASVGHYTANPTVGTSVGNISSYRITFNQTGITSGSVLWDFSNQPITLRGTSEQLCLNFSSTSVTGSRLSISIEWQEV